MRSSDPVEITLQWDLLRPGSEAIVFQCGITPRASLICIRAWIALSRAYVITSRTPAEQRKLLSIVEYSLRR